MYPPFRAALDVTLVVHCAAQLAFNLESIPDEPLHRSAKFLCQVSEVMVRLQLHPPLSQVCFPHLDNLDNWDFSTRWPTISEPPSALSLSDWGKVETVACRLFVTLEWASNKAVAATEALCEDDCSRLRENLLLVLTHLLHGYLQDDRNAMQKLFR